MLYFRLVKTKQNQKFRSNALNEDEPKRRKKKDNIPLLTEKQIDTVIMQLQINTDINVRYCEDQQQFSLFVASFTKAIAETPFK